MLASERAPDRENCPTLDGARDGYREALPLELDPQPAFDEMEPDVVLSFPKLAEVSKGKVTKDVPCETCTSSDEPAAVDTGRERV